MSSEKVDFKGPWMLKNKINFKKGGGTFQS